MKKIWNKSWFIRIVSLLLAILIVVYIDSTQSGFFTQGQNSRTQETASEKRTIKMPLQVSVNTDKYYVTGYPEKIKITLEGPNALVTSAINTQNFRVYLDLTEKNVGVHTVKVQVSGLSKQISYTVAPKNIKVNIQQRKSRLMPVQIEYNKNVVANGYTLGKASVDPSQVEVTGALGEVNQIDQIVAKLALPNHINHNYERQVILVAEDKKGRQLNVVIQPATARVSIPVSISKKKVKLNLKSRNEASNKVYSVTAKEHEVTIYGKKDKLDEIKQADLDINLTGIDHSESKLCPVKLPTGAVRVNPQMVQVQIKVKNTSSTKQS